MTIAEHAERLLLGMPPKGPVQPAWLDATLELLRDIATRPVSSSTSAAKED